MTLGVALYIDGVKVADGSPDDDPTAPYAIDGLTVTWGRPTTVDQPDSSTCTFTLYSRTDVPDPDLFATKITLGRRIDVRATSEPPAKDVHVFVGSITDVSMVPADDDPSGLLILSVAADDLLADLNNRPAGTTPWPKETVATRFSHVIGAARTGTPYTIASDLLPIQIKKLDADQGSGSMVAALLQDIAASLDAVLWSTVDSAGTAKLTLESPAQRLPLRRLALVGTWVQIINAPSVPGALVINTCIPSLEPVEFRQTMSDLVTGVSVTYYVPDPDDPTAADVGITVNVVDTASESPTKPWGVRRMTVDSQLTTSVDATNVAKKLLDRLSIPSWRLNNVAVDQATHPTLSDADMLRLLDAGTRGGTPLILTPLPAWAPPDSDTFSGYLEGADLVSTQGFWSASLWISLAQNYGGGSVHWIELPNLTSWAWQHWDPTIRWQDLVHVGGPVTRTQGDES